MIRCEDLLGFSAASSISSIFFSTNARLYTSYDFKIAFYSVLLQKNVVKPTFLSRDVIV